MAWTSPRTWVTNETVTAALMNTHVRDNLAALRDSTPHARLTSGAATSVTHNASFPTWVQVTFDTESFDSDNMGSIGTEQIIIQTAGVYFVNAYGSFAANVTGQRGLRFTMTGGVTFPQDIRQAAGAGATNMVISTLAAFAVSDTIGLEAAQNSGGALNLSSPLLSAFRVSA